MLERNDLITKNLRLVYYVADRYLKNEYDRDEMISIGMVGLIKAADTYDAEKGACFATYAVRCIENELNGELRKMKRQKQLYTVSLDKNPSQVDLFVYEDAFDAFTEQDDLYDAISNLKESEQLLITLRYAIGSNTKIPLTQEQAAKILGISQSTFSRKEKRILKQLRENM